MKRKISIVFIAAISFVLLNLGLNFAQEEASFEQAEVVTEPDTQWLWGEIISLDSANKTLIVKYLDYDTETEKEMMLSVNGQTTYENAKSLDELKPQDTVNIDYMVSPEGQNIAKNISLEKPESTEVTPQEATPIEVSPEENAEAVP